MKTLLNKEVNYSLQNNENFKKELDCDISDITENLSELLLNYYKFIIGSIKLKNLKNLRFIIIRGLDTILNVFNLILFYTKNLDITYFHCQKAFYLYVEFIEQISEDENIFLQLSSRDATTYVYKKTIYEISNEFKKKNEQISDYTIIKLDIINSYTNIYKILLLKLINDDFTNEEHQNNIQKIYKKLIRINDKTIIKLLNDIIGKLYYELSDITYFYDVSNLLIKKICKNEVNNVNIVNNVNNINNVNNFLNKFLSDEFSIKKLESPDNFVKWFMS
jgi:hypothetical protein